MMGSAGLCSGSFGVRLAGMGGQCVNFLGLWSEAQEPGPLRGVTGARGFLPGWLLHPGQEDPRLLGDMVP